MRRAAALPLLERLEDRLLLAADPVVTVTDGPGDDNGDALIGQQNMTMTLTFDNASPTDMGYSPYIDVILPSSGEDGDDGVTFDSAGFLGTPLTANVQTFGASGQLAHPFAVDAAGAPLIVTGAEGDQLVVLTLPFGSFAPDQTPAEVEITLDLSNLADRDAALNIQTRGGFALGGDPQDNPATDPSITGSFGAAGSDATLTPRLAVVAKEDNAPENETATGPNFVRTWTSTITLAPGQTITNLVFEDVLPTNIVYQGNLTVGNAAPGAITEPGVGAPITPANRDLSVALTPTGGDITVAFDYYIGETDASGGDVLNATTGDDSLSQNNIRVKGDWDPLDPRDAQGAFTLDARAVDDEIALKSITLRKSEALTTDVNAASYSPGDEVTYTLVVDVSDYFAMGAVTLNDLLPDGMSFVAGSALFAISQNGASSAAAAFNAANIASAATATPGETALTFRLSDEMISRGFAADGVMRGDLATDGAQTGATTATVTYRATIDDTFDAAAGDVEVSQGDTLSNTATLGAEVRDRTNVATVLGTESDGSAASFDIAEGVVNSKAIALVNDAAPPPDLVLTAGDKVTYEIRYTAPQGSFEELKLTDYLPAPVFDVDSAAAWTFVYSDATQIPAGIPDVGEVQFAAGTDANYLAALVGQAALVPDVSINSGSNSMAVDFHTVSLDPRQSIDIVIRFSVQVEDQDFSDRLVLTNQVTAAEADTTQTFIDTTRTSNFTYAEPGLEITKGVIATNARNPTFSLTPPPGVTFNAPGSATPFAGTISSDALDVRPINANLNGADGGDLVTFAIVIENTGTSPYGAFDITFTDTKPPGLDIPTGAPGLNLKVRDGSGAALTYTGNLFDPGGIQIDDRSATEGAAKTFNATSGENIIVITYDLQVPGGAAPRDFHVNTAAVTNYNATETSTFNRVPTAGLSDDARVDILDTTLTKTLVTTSVGADASPRLQIGEIAEYDIVITFAEGVTRSAVFTDRPVSGGAAQDPDFGHLNLIDAKFTQIGGTLAFADPAKAPVLNATFSATDSNADSIRDLLRHDFGTVTNPSDNLSDANDTITIRVRALVDPDADTEAGDRLRNRATLAYDGLTKNAQADIRVIEPNISVSKTPSAANADGGDVVTYTITVSNPANLVGGVDYSATAYDLVLSDLISDADLTLVAQTFQQTAGPVAGVVITKGGAANPATDTTVEATIAELASGATLTFTYQGRIAPTPSLGDDISNTATLTGTSMAGAGPERSYTDSDTAKVTPPPPGITKTLASSSVSDAAGTTGAELVVGEIATFLIETTIPEGVAPILIKDLLPTSGGRFDYVSSRVTVIGSDLVIGSGLAVNDVGQVSGNEISFDFGQVSNTADGDSANENIVIEIKLRVADVAANVDGRSVINTAQLIYGPDPGDRSTGTNTTTVVEPDLKIEKGGPIATELGEEATYTLTISHEAGSSAAGRDIRVTDLLADPWLTYKPGSVSAVASDGSAVVAADAAAGFEVTMATLAEGETLTITYVATLDPGAPSGIGFENTANLSYDSNPGPGGRNATATDTHLMGAVPDIEKSLVSSSLAQTSGNNLAIGEVATFRLDVILPDGANTNVEVIDTLPAGLTYVATRLVAVGADLTGAAAPAVSVAGQQIRYDFGAVANADNGPYDATDRIIIEVDAVANTNIAPTLTNQSLMRTTFGGVNFTRTDNLDVVPVLPDISVDKNAAPIYGLQVGDVIDFTFDVVNSGGAPAFDMTIEDLMAGSGFTLVSGSVAASNGAVATEVAAPSGELGFTLDVDELAAGASVTISYSATALRDGADGVPVENVARVAVYDTNPDEPGDPDFELELETTSSASDRSSPLVDRVRFFPLLSEDGTSEDLRPYRGWDEPERRFDSDLRVDAIFSGSAEYGAALGLFFFDRAGAPLASSHVVADAGGGWIALAPSIEIDAEDVEFSMFHRPEHVAGREIGGLGLSGAPRSILSDMPEPRRASIGSPISGDVYRVGLNHQSGLDGEMGEFNVRLFFAPPLAHEIYVSHHLFDISQTIDGVAGAMVARDLSAAQNPLAAGLNRFNAEFLARSATPGG